MGRPGLARRDLLRAGAVAAGLSAVGLLPGSAEAAEVDVVDYVVIGSGPGGAPLAARLAEAGFEVLVLEAGPPEGDKTWYDVPALSNRAAAADEMIRWDYFVRHYSDVAFNKQDTKWIHDKGGILYPRASTLGGCTAHNALITMYPEHEDWAYIQRLTRDDSWAPDKMWEHWETGVLSWQRTEYPLLPNIGQLDPQLGGMIGAAKNAAAQLAGGDVVNDPQGVNKRGNVDKSAQGFFLPQQMSWRGKRYGPRERLRLAQQATNGRLTIVTDALAERVVLESAPDGRQRAVAVDYLAGRHIYRACPAPRPTTSQERQRMRRTVRVRKEVIVAGGAFSSPQLLMLSGIGPKDHLTRFGIPVKVDLAGVGENLQDRYEISVVTKHFPPFAINFLCQFGKKDTFDPCLMTYGLGQMVGLDGTVNIYGSNGVLAGIRRRYGADKRNQLYIFGAPTDFRGYKPGFDSGYDSFDNFSWLILKGYADSRIGNVRLRSADPTQPPDINFRFFQDARSGGKDMEALMEAVAMVRRINQGRSWDELWPGSDKTGDELKKFILKEAWGHHASCTNPIGPASDPKAVLDSRFRVRGTTNLRVVDASAFPRIPGLFIWAPTAILSEKASADILQDSGTKQPTTPK